MSEDEDPGYEVLVISEFEYATSKGANPQEFMRVTGDDGTKYCCWDHHLFARIEECKGLEVKAVVQFPPQSTAARGAKPKITQILAAREPRKKVEVDDASIPF